MAFLGNEKKTEIFSDRDSLLYQALASGDLPAAWLLAEPMTEVEKTEKLSVQTAFNCGLCLYRLKEYEKALVQLKRAEQFLGMPPDLDAREKKLFFQAMDMAQQVFLLPLDPNTGRGLERYFLIRVRWLTAHCLLQMGRRQEAAPAIRFLNQYHIEI